MRSIDGLPVIDSMHSAKLIITDEDIKAAEGSQQDPGNCVIAKACLRALHAKQAFVHRSRIYIQLNKSNFIRYCTPPSLRSEQIAFDRGGRFAPGVYHLQRIEPKHRMGAQPDGRKRGPHRMMRTPPHVITDVRVRAG